MPSIQSTRARLTATEVLRLSSLENWALTQFYLCGLPVLLNEPKMWVRHFTEHDPSILPLQNNHFQKAFQRTTSLRTSPVLTCPGPWTPISSSLEVPQQGRSPAPHSPARIQPRWTRHSSPQPCPDMAPLSWAQLPTALPGHGPTEPGTAPHSPARPWPRWAGHSSPQSNHAMAPLSWAQIPTALPGPAMAPLIQVQLPTALLRHRHTEPGTAPHSPAMPWPCRAGHSPPQTRHTKPGSLSWPMAQPGLYLPERFLVPGAEATQCPWLSCSWPGGAGAGWQTLPCFSPCRTSDISAPCDAMT